MIIGDDDDDDDDDGGGWNMMNNWLIYSDWIIDNDDF